MNTLFKIMEFLLNLFEIGTSVIGFFCILYFVYYMQKNFQIKIAFSVLSGVLVISLILCSLLKREYRIVTTETELGNNKLAIKVNYSSISLAKFYQHLTENELNNAESMLQEVIKEEEKRKEEKIEKAKKYLPLFEEKRRK